MPVYRFALSFAVILASLTLAGCEQGNEPAGPPAVIPPDAPKSSEEALNIGKGAPDPTKKPGPPAPPPPVK